MASFIVKNMQYVISSGRSRIPRQPATNASNPPGLAPINGAQIIAQGAGPNTQFYSIPPQPSFTVNGTQLYYAFTSLSGGVEGGKVTSDISAQISETVTASSADIVQLNVYLPHGNYGPGGGPGAIIDAFDEMTGMFVDDIFVDVAPDANGSITHDANYLGAFSTAGATETVSAHSFIIPTQANFDQWLIMPGTGDASDTITGNKLSAGKNSNVVAFAFYNHPAKNNLLEHKPDGWWEHGAKTLFDNIHINPGDPVSNPGLMKQLQDLSQRLGVMESKINAQGSAFVKPASRPAVGKTVAAKASKRSK